MIQRLGRFLLGLGLTGALACGGGDGGGAADAAVGPDAVSSTTVTLSVTDGSLATGAALVAFRAGDGGWEAVAGSGGVYTTQVASGRYSVAMVCAEAEAGDVRHRVLHLLTQEATELAWTCASTPPTELVSGAVAGIAADQDVAIHLGPTFTMATDDEPTYEVTAAPGMVDAFVGADDGRVLVAHDVVLDADDPVDFDLTTDGADLVDSDAAATGALEGETPELESTLVTDRGLRVYLGSSTTAWRGLPAIALAGDDIHVVAATAGSSELGTSRTRYRFVAAPTDLSVALPAPGEAPAIERLDGSPYARLRATPTADGDALLHQLEFSVPGGTRFWNERATAGWLAAAGAFAVDTTDLSDVDGWSDDWGVPEGETLRWFHSAFASEGGAGTVLDGMAAESGAPPVAGLDGVEIDQARSSGELAP